MNRNNRNNLQKLATFLAYGQMPDGVEFDMRWFSDADHNYRIGVSDCGTVGCAVGHGPYAGVEKKIGESWDEYAGRAFMSTDTLKGEWCFHPNWTYVDNTRIGAAKRIQYLLDNGKLPVDFYCPRERYKELYRDVVVKGEGV